MGLNSQGYKGTNAGPGLRAFEGYFYPNGSGTITDGYTPGVTAARTDVGVFTLTLREEVADVVYAHCELAAATAIDSFAKVKTVAASAGVITGAVWDISGNAVAELPAANADTKLFYRIVVRNTAATA